MMLGILQVCRRGNLPGSGCTALLKGHSQHSSACLPDLHTNKLLSSPMSMVQAALTSQVLILILSKAFKQQAARVGARSAAGGPPTVEVAIVRPQSLPLHRLL